MALLESHEDDAAYGLELQEQLKQLVGYEGAPEGLAERLAVEDRGGLMVCAWLVQALAPQDTLAGRADAGSELFSTVQALQIVVRILGTLSGDPGGDTVMEPIQPGGQLAQALRSEALTLTVADLLQRHAAQFAAGEEPWLQLEGLRALRLLLLVPKATAPGDAEPQHAWWIERDIGYSDHSETRRGLVDAAVLLLNGLKDCLNPLPKIAILGCLRNLATGSRACLKHLTQTRVAETVVAMLRAQIRVPPPPALDLFVGGCLLLVAISVGPRIHLRKLAEAGVDDLAVSLLQQFLVHREVAAAAFVLLGVVCKDESCSAKLSSAGGAETLKAASAAAARWPLQVAEAARAAKQPLAPQLSKLLDAKGSDS